MRKGVILLILSGLATAVIAKEKEDKSASEVATDKKPSNSSDLEVEAQSDSPTVLYPPNGSPPIHKTAPYPPPQVRYIPGYMHIHPIRPPHGYVVLNAPQLLQKPPAGNPGSHPRYIFFQQPDHSSEKANGNEVLYEVPISNSRPLSSGNRGLKPESQSEIPPRGPPPPIYTGPPHPATGHYPPGPPTSRLNHYPSLSRYPGYSLYPARPNRYAGPLTPGYSRYRGPPAPPPSSRYPGPPPSSRYPAPPPSSHYPPPPPSSHYPPPPPSSHYPAPPPSNSIRNSDIPPGPPPPPPSNHYPGPPPSSLIRNPDIPPGPPPPPPPPPDSSYYPAPRPVTPYSSPDHPSYHSNPPSYHSGANRPESHPKDLAPPQGNQFYEPYPPGPISSDPRQKPYTGSPPPPHNFRNTQSPVPPRPPSHIKLEDGRSIEDLPRSKDRYPDTGIVRKPSLQPPGGSYNSHESSEEYDSHYAKKNYNTVRPPPRPSSPDLPPNKLHPPLPPPRHSYPNSEENSGEDHSQEYSKPPNTHQDSLRSPPPRNIRPPPPYGPISSHSSSSYSPGYNSHSSSSSGNYHPQSNYDSDRGRKYHSHASSEEDYNSHPPSHHSNVLPHSHPRGKPESPTSYTERKPVGPPSSQVPVYKPPIRSRYNPTGPPPSLQHHSEIPGLRYTPEHPSLQSAHHTESLPPRLPQDHSGERYEHPIPPRPYYGPPHIFRDEGPPRSFPPPLPHQGYPSESTLRKPIRDYGPPDHYADDYNSVSHPRDESSSHEDDYPPRPYIPHEPIAPPSPRTPTEPRRPKPPRISYSEGDTRQSQNSAAKRHRHGDDEKDDSEEEPSGSTAAIPGEPGKDYPVLSSRPSTNFNCHNKPPGYYADIEHRCQVYYLCGPQGHLQSFLCPNGTIFNQATFVCEWWYNVDCDESEKHYARNNDLYKVPDPELKNAEKSHPDQRHSSQTSSIRLRPSFPTSSRPGAEHRDYLPPEQHISDDHEPSPHALPEYRSREPPRYPPSHQLILPHPSEQRHPVAPPPPPPPTQRHPLPSAPPPSHRQALSPLPPQAHRPPDLPSERHPLPPLDPPSPRHPLPPIDLPPQRHPLPPPPERRPGDYRGAYSHPDDSRYRSSEEDDNGPYEQESFQSFRTVKLDAKKIIKNQTEKKKD